MSVDMHDSLIIKWHQNTPKGHCRWFIRRLQTDGSYFAEVEVLGSGGRHQSNTEASLSAADNQRLRMLVKRMWQALADGGRRIEDTPGWLGLLAHGNVASPTVIMRYYKDDERESEVAKWFLEIIDILRPYFDDSDNQST